MSSIPGGGGAGDEGEREIGGGGAGPRAREGNELKCPSYQRPERDIGWASVRRAKLEIPSFVREIYRRP
jgi:hypothetical protein